MRLGHVVATPAALAILTKTDIIDLLGRHSRGDWGDVCEEDRQANEYALVEGARLFSVYKQMCDDGTSSTTFWVITEADRSSTTILLPSDY